VVSKRLPTLVGLHTVTSDGRNGAGP
jgi:hypothetical protein